MSLEPTSSLYGTRLVIAYDGTNLSGWQRQPGIRTAQGLIEDAIETMAGTRIEVRGASRTDQGVHALGQVAAFDCEKQIDPRGWMLGLNTRMPADVSIVQAEPCAVGYNPRFDTTQKTYRYLVLFGEPRIPLLRHHAWHMAYSQLGASRTGRGSPPIDLEAMKRAASMMLGTHDFKAFRQADDDRKNTVRTMHAIDFHVGHNGYEELLAIDVRGTSFMKNTVRIMVGTLVDIGRGTRSEKDIEVLLSPAGTRHVAGQTAPAHGLTLLEIKFGRAALLQAQQS